jgi:hypothetical protein
MTEAEWLACPDPIPMLALHGICSDLRKRRLFAVACCRRIADLLTRSGVKAVNAAELFADGATSQRELHDAWRGIGFPRVIPRGYAAAAARAACVFSSGYDGTTDATAFAANARAKKPGNTRDKQRVLERAAQADLVRDIFGNPFRTVSFAPEWRTDTAVSLARQMYQSRDFSAMPILADALQDAGCDNHEVLAHCRDTKQAHVRGCWVVDGVLGLGGSSA